MTQGFLHLCRNGVFQNNIFFFVLFVSFVVKDSHC